MKKNLTIAILLLATVVFIVYARIKTLELADLRRLADLERARAELTQAIADEQRRLAGENQDRAIAAMAEAERQRLLAIEATKECRRRSQSR